MTERSTSQDADAADARLCDADCEALDALVECGWDAAQLSGEQRLRAERLVETLALMERDVVEGADGPGLLAATMLSIEQFERSRRRPVIAANDAMTDPSWWALAASNWRNVLTAAAALLVLASVMAPMLTNMRRTAMQQTCLGGLGQVAQAMSSYAGAYDNSLPVRYEAPPTGNWLDTRINAANLFHLAKAGFSSFDQLTCPGNTFAEDSASLAALDNWPSSRATSFSFQNVLTKLRPRWETAPTMVVLADKNPVVEAARKGQEIEVDASAACHRRGRAGVLSQHGQNALLSDGSALWLTSAQFGNDNIWIPDSCQSQRTTFVGTEMPGCEFDSMLIH